MKNIFNICLLPNGIDADGNFKMSARITINPNQAITDINETELRELILSRFLPWIQDFSNVTLSVTEVNNITPRQDMLVLEKDKFDPLYRSDIFNQKRADIYATLFSSNRGIYDPTDLNLFNYLPKSADLLDREVARKDLRSILDLRLKMMRAADTQSAVAVAEDVITSAAELRKPLTYLEANLAGISDFSEQTNIRQFDQLNHGQSASSVQNLPNGDATWIFESFSHIGGNPILQRIFGLTIDFTVASSFLEKFPPVFDAKLIIPGTPLGEEMLMTPSTRMTVVTLGRSAKKALLLVSQCRQNSRGLIFSPEELAIASYDKIAMLKSLKPFLEQMAALEGLANHSELDRVNLVRERLKFVSTALTRGVNIYHADWISNSITCAQQIFDKDNNILQTIGEDTVLREENLVRGHRFAVIEDNHVTPLGVRNCDINVWDEKSKKYKLSHSVENDEFSVTTDAGMLAVANSDGNVSALVDNALLTWGGENIGMPSMFAVHEDDDAQANDDDKGSVSGSTNTVVSRLKKIFREAYYPFNLQDEDPSMHPKFSLDYFPCEKVNPKLLFGKTYTFAVKNAYLNGWAVPWTSSNPFELSLSEMENLKKKSSIPQIFKRNEPVRPLYMVAREKLLEKDGTTVVQGKAGESITDLAIRSQRNDRNTYEKSSRHILPPQVAFEHAMWHNKIFEMNYREGYSWYLKYHDPKNADTIKMPSYADQPTLTPKYLPDPLCIGFRLEFFLDEGRTLPAEEYGNELEFYFKGEYPQKESFLLTMVEDDFNGNKIELDDQEIVVKVRKGLVLYGIARTILDKKYEAEMETHGNYNDYTRFGNNDILTPPIKFSMTHAVSLPLVTPHILNHTYNKRLENATNLRFDINVHLEQLHLHRDRAGLTKYIDQTLPTGDVVLLAKWEEYIDDASKVLFSGDADPSEPVTQLGVAPIKYETSIDLGPQLTTMSGSIDKVDNNPNPSKNFAVNLKVGYDIKSTPYLEKWYYLKNSSKFSKYFPEITRKDNFSLTSREGFMMKVLNNKKPSPPSVHKIVPLIVKEEWGRETNRSRVTRGNRFRVYLERGRLTSGKGERLAVMVNEPYGPYNEDLFNKDLISMVGRDITSLNQNPYDGMYESSRVLLQQSSFNIYDPYVIEEGAKDLEKFKPRYVAEFGCMTYEPLFDRESNLWYCDIEMDVNDEHGRELHCVMIQLMLAHYQENSENHNDPSNGENPPDLRVDCRLSEIIKSQFVYMLPSRIVNVRQPANNTVTVNIQCDDQSLKWGEGDKLMTAFFAAIQQSTSKGNWTTIESNQKEKAKYHLIDFPMAESLKLTYAGGGWQTSYRLVVAEAELFATKNEAGNWIMQENPFECSNLEDHLGKRIVLIDLYDLD